MPKKGTIVLIPFPFTDLSANKVRPAVVVSDNLKGDDVIVVFISSKKIKRALLLDVKISSSSKAFAQTGLKTDSVVKVGKIATLDKKIIIGELGSMNKGTMREINKKIKILFGL
jgi:mRNA interferase MazF